MPLTAWQNRPWKTFLGCFTKVVKCICILQVLPLPPPLTLILITVNSPHASRKAEPEVQIKEGVQAKSVSQRDKRLLTSPSDVCFRLIQIFLRELQEIRGTSRDTFHCVPVVRALWSGAEPGPIRSKTELSRFTLSAASSNLLKPHAQDFCFQPDMTISF